MMELNGSLNLQVITVLLDSFMLMVVLVFLVLHKVLKEIIFLVHLTILWYVFNSRFNGDNGVTSVRFSYRYRGAADLSIFNMDRLKIDAQSTMDLLIRYTPNSDDWYAGLYIKNIRDQQLLNNLRESSNVGGGSLLGSFTDPRTYGIEFGAKF